MIGGVNIAQQYVKDGLLDEIEIYLVPVLLCDGIRLLSRLSFLVLFGTR